MNQRTNMKLKFINLLLLLALGKGLLIAETYTGYCGENLTWSFNTEDSTLVIEGCGEMSNWEDRSYIPWDRFKSKIAYLSLPNGLVNISNKAFQNCFNLVSVPIPESVLTIGDDAFNACTSLSSVMIPDSVSYIGRQAFVHCTSLYSLTIGQNVTTIEEYAFSTCNSLNSVIIPENVTTIGEGAFASCTSLTSIDVHTNNPYFCSKEGVLYSIDKTSLLQFPGGRSGEYIIPNTVVNIANHAFRNCRSLNSITIPNTVNNIGEAAFYLCTNLDSLTNLSVNPQIIGNTVFGNTNISECKLFVIKESLSLYKTAEIWKDFGQIIGVDAPQGIENTILKRQSQKVLHNSQIYIKNSDKTYTLTGQETK